MRAEELLSVLIKMSRVDNYFDEYEFGYLLKVGAYLGIPNYTVEDMIKNPQEVSFKVPAEEEKRMQVLYYLLFLMKIDRVITEEEIETVHHYGFKLGFSKPMIDEFVDVMKEHRYEDVPTEIMINIIRKYQN